MNAPVDQMDIEKLYRDAAEGDPRSPNEGSGIFFLKKKVESW